jgi:hypothetical protein
VGCEFDSEAVGDGRAVELVSPVFGSWSGIRIWESLDRDLRVEAQHHARGYVEMTWTLSPHDCARPNTWSASVVTGLEAGEEMRRFAVTVHRFLRPS